MPWIFMLVLSLAQVSDQPSRELTLDMHERFAYAAMTRTALIHGYVDRARRHAAQLKDLLKDTESVHVADLAQRVIDADNVADAALAVAQIGESCGQCHEGNRVRPMFLGHAPAPKGNSLVAKMGRHIWAADRMWEGLIAHSPDTWQRGAKALSRENAFFADRADIPAARVEEINRIATRAAKPQSWPKRAQAYGEFLAACSNCHQAFAQQSSGMKK